jgi:hypothetical protein
MKTYVKTRSCSYLILIRDRPKVLDLNGRKPASVTWSGAANSRILLRLVPIDDPM